MRANEESDSDWRLRAQLQRSMSTIRGAGKIFEPRNELVSFYLVHVERGKQGGRNTATDRRSSRLFGMAV